MAKNKCYWDSFSFEWLAWPTTQLDGPGQDESETTFIRKTGLTPADVKGKMVLDVGCGSGRFLEVVSRWGARLAVGCDPSEAWAKAYNNLVLRLQRGNVSVHQMSIEDIDTGLFYGKAFDLVYCLGVLHHTPDPAASFRAIAKLVKPGGTLCVWVYAQMGPWSRVTDLYRKVTVHLPWTLLRALCLLAGPWFHVRRIPRIGKWLWGLFPCSLHPNWRWRWLDTFDWYSPRYQWKHTEAEVKAWFLDSGFTDLQVFDFPVSVRGRRL